MSGRGRRVRRWCRCRRGGAGVGAGVGVGPIVSSPMMKIGPLPRNSGGTAPGIIFAPLTDDPY
ncbi:MAG: hypothetical protein HC849_08210 [Oscillatoriales cyanobacterium RU_3_3]|nr:hypothetical protein [Oscillatoriales cyanobacterium RU_3_3]